MGSQRFGRESHALWTLNQDPHGVAGGPFALLPGPGVHKAVTEECRARSLTLGAVARPEQGLLVLAVICRGEKEGENTQCFREGQPHGGL